MKKVTGHLHQRQAGGNWYVRYTVDGKPIEKSTGTSNRKQAEAIRAEWLSAFKLQGKTEVLQAVAAQLADTETKLAAIDAQRHPPPEIRQIWSRFLDSPSRPDSGESTLHVYSFKWKRFEVWLGEKYPDAKHLHEVTPAIATAYAKDLTAAKMSASTFNQHKNLLRMVWRALTDECRLTVNPWDKVQPKKLTPLANRKRSLTPAQFESLIAAVEGTRDLKDLFTLLAWTGLRLADAVLMKWGSIDFSRRVISLAPIKTARRQGKLVHIPIFPAAAEVLNRRQAGKALNPRGFVFPELADQYARDASAISKVIAQAFERAGMQTTERRADRSRGVVVFGAHSLRHFFVTAATAAGMPDAMIKTITGHSTDGMLEHYQQIGADLAVDLAGQIQGAGTALLPESGLPSDLDAFRTRIRTIADGMTARTWKTAQAELLELAEGV
jgi:integrase